MAVSDGRPPISCEMPMAIGVVTDQDAMSRRGIDTLPG
jgi:hypothetical protein